MKLFPVRGLLATVAMAVMALSLVACGGDDTVDAATDSSETTAQTTAETTATTAEASTTESTEAATTTEAMAEVSEEKQAYIDEANAICTESMMSMGSDVDPQMAPEEVVTEVVLPSIRDQIAQLRALTPPAGDEEKMTSIYDQADAVLDGIEADPAAAMASSDDPFAAVNAEMADYGLTACAA